MTTKTGVDDYMVAGATGEDLNGLPRVETWPHLAPEALHGVAGRVVAAVDPYSEADPVATLLTFLVCVGNLLGTGVQARAGEDPHPGRLYVALVGLSSKGRKGMSWRGVKRILAPVDGPWSAARVVSGLSSGEGVIYHVRDAREEQQAIKERGRVVGYETVVVDHGVGDKRLCVEEPEFASVLKRMSGESNSLSAILRQGWDDGTLGTLTKNSPLRATGAHLSVLAHVTKPELVLNLGATEHVNGFANRFLFVLVERSKELPDPEALPEHVLAPLVDEVSAVVEWVRHRDGLVIRRDADAAALWAGIYSRLSAERPGLLGAVTARAEAHVLRLSALYAILDRSESIRVPHLAAGLAVWAHADTSARLIFGERTGDAIADTIEAALRKTGPLTRTAIRDLFHRHQSDERIEAALTALETEGRARQEKRETGGRPSTVWEVVAR